MTNVFQEYPYEGCDSNSAVSLFPTPGNPRVTSAWLTGQSIGCLYHWRDGYQRSALAEAVDQLLIGPGGSKIELPASRTYATAIYRLQLLAQALADVLKVVDDPDEYRTPSWRYLSR